MNFDSYLLSPDEIREQIDLCLKTAELAGSKAAEGKNPTQVRIRDAALEKVDELNTKLLTILSIQNMESNEDRVENWLSLAFSALIKQNRGKDRFSVDEVWEKMRFFMIPMCKAKKKEHPRGE